MSEDPPSNQSQSSPGQYRSRSWFNRLFNGFAQEPKSREELLDMIKGAADSKVVDQEALSIIEGALDVANRQVRDIMVSRSQMAVVQVDEPPEEFLPRVIETGHSRFPVIGESIDDIVGILLAKDLLHFLINDKKQWDLRSILRTANIIPESKRLNVLLKEFREQRYHMALVIDEYGGISGLVTIEDVLEEIVGEIEDETDEDEEDFIRKVGENDYIVKALTSIEDFNDYFKAQLSNEYFDTLGGIVTQAFGHMPSRNESVEIGPFRFRVLYSDSRQVHLLRVCEIK